jgi:GNAT superfamily N-acetyltransferase
MPEVRRRRLSAVEARLLSEEVRRTPNVTAWGQRELEGRDRVLALGEGEGLIGALAWSEGPAFVDLKLLIVVEGQRGRGHGRVLFDAFMDRHRGGERLICCLTREPIMAAMLRSDLFERCHPLSLPPAALAHQAEMLLSASRAREWARKSLALPRRPPLLWYARRPWALVPQRPEPLGLVSSLLAGAGGIEPEPCGA